MNKIITIGYLGLQNAYLNLDKEVAIERYCKSEEITRDEYEKHDFKYVFSVIYYFGDTGFCA